jgi:hypothetical protein
MIPLVLGCKQVILVGDHQVRLVCLFFYRTHDAMGYIPSDVQSLRSQATYTSGLPMFNAPRPFGPGTARGLNGTKRSQYSYACSIVSQDAGPSVADTGSVVGGGGGSVLGVGVGGGSSAGVNLCEYRVLAK